ncbi:MAG: hypothetical protein AB7S83_06050 [Candidatus Methanomethylophilaceae archaeon]
MPDSLLTVRENIRAGGALYGPGKDEFEKRILQASDAGEFLDCPCGKLSRSLRRRSDAARALVGRPGIPMPDEPTTGLDPQTGRDIWNTVLRPKEDDMTVFLTAHYMEEAEDTGSGCGHQQGEGHSSLYAFRARRKIQFGYPFDHVEKHGRPTAALEGTP